MILAAMIIGAILGGLVASNKGRNIFVWAVLCGIMPLALFILFAIPRQPQIGVWRPCPFCLTVVPWSATVCASCKNSLPRAHVHPCAYCAAPIWAGQNVCTSCGQKDTTEEKHYDIEKT